MVTIQDVAREAGVSPMTVSNVINDRPHVRESTRARVVAAMSALDYRVNVAARNLRAGRTFTIGLAVAQIDQPYWGQFAARVLTEAARHGLRVAIEQTGARRENELEALTMSRNRMYDGLILSTVGLGETDVDKLRVDYPVVILGERIFDGPVDHVAMPNVDGSAAAVQHLVEQGCRHIAFVDGDTGDGINASNLRRTGYRQALAAAGIEHDPRLDLPLPGTWSAAAGRDIATQLVHSGLEFDGIFCVTDTVALGVLRGLADCAVRVPEQVKVIGFDNILEGEFSVPSLSTVDPDHPSMARAAVDLLIARINAKATVTAPVEFVSTARVVTRGSTASTRSDITGFR